MKDYVKEYIEKIEEILNRINKKIELIIIGGLAMSFYGHPRYTIDIDGEIHCDEETYNILVTALRKEGINFNIGENISGWGIVPLPEGYRDRAKKVYESDHLILKILDPLDFIFTKLTRGTEEDFQDILNVIKNYRITREMILEREKLIRYPKDPETFFFKKKIEHLLKLMELMH
mgnify:FL=1